VAIVVDDDLVPQAGGFEPEAAGAVGTQADYAPDDAIPRDVDRSENGTAERRARRSRPRSAGGTGEGAEHRLSAPPQRGPARDSSRNRAEVARGIAHRRHRDPPRTSSDAPPNPT
jgi:hypothetical protein